ncbi:MAG TPA: AlkA N-terminal domain-containing protein [Solirubrobacteraceae bacterium]|nr:AlkA N-terminal domain-containing protein [Solirubrobacteraceae bacterium]
MLPDADSCWRAAQAEDPRFDGWIFVGVTSTGIYCRPSCPARTPKRENVRFFSTAAAAQAAGLRACMRCRPDASPGSPEWDRGGDAVGRAMRLIADGVVDREGVGGVAARLGYTERHLHRLLVGVVGVGPLGLARAQRARTARILLQTTTMAIAEVALAAGFGSVRQFNATIREVFAMSPTELRARVRREPDIAEGDAGVALRLPYRSPLDTSGLLDYLARRAVPGIEQVRAGVYTRSLRLPHGSATAQLRPADGHLGVHFAVDDPRDLATAVQRTRALLDLDSDPAAVTDALGGDPLLGPLRRRAPGMRVPGTVDGPELAIRAVLGQQVSLAAAATAAGRLVAAHGQPLKRPLDGVTHAFPDPGTLAALDPEALPMPASRGRALTGLAARLASGELTLDGGADREEARRGLLGVPGVGPWTAEYVAMRALRDPDAFLAGDLGIHHALRRHGLDGRPAAAERLSQGWRPYRAYAVIHLWADLAAAAATAALAA